MATIADRLHAENKKISFTNGIFDLLHPGHTQFLEYCRSLGDVLMVAINSDASTKRFKGPTRPIYDQTSRSLLLSAIGAVDYVTIFEENDPKELMARIKPDFWVKCGTSLEKRTAADLARWDAESSVVTKYGGKALMIPPFGTYSATNTINKIKEQCK